MKAIIQGLKLLRLQRIKHVGFGLCVLLFWGVGQSREVWGQTGNASDVTGVDTIELVPETRAEPTNAETTEDRIDRSALDQQITDPNLSPSNAFTLQSQALTQGYSTVLQDLGIELEGQEPSPETIADLLSLSLNITGNNAHYVQISLTQNDQVVMTRVGPDPTLLSSNALPKSIPDRPNHLSKSFLNLSLRQKSTSPARLFRSKELLSQLPPTVSPAENDLVSRYIVPNLSGDRVQRLIREYRSQIERDGSLTQAIGQRLYDLLIRPLEADLEAEGVETIVFAMDSDLLGLPLAALQDGETFMVEKYAMAVIPSFGLADIGYTDIRQQPVLAVGSSTFRDQAELPAVPIEIANIARTFRQRSLLNEQFTVANFVNTFQEMASQGERAGIIHLATHGEFAPENYRNSYIQFQDRRVSLVEFRNLAVQLGWDLPETAPEMLVLSACRTAVGDSTAELGFGGLAIATGAKTALASLWYVSDLGTLALMSEFYEVLQEIPLKSQALQQAQLNLLKGATQLRSGQLILSSGRAMDLPPQLANQPDQDFSNPYYWSAFTLIGNWN